MPESFATPPGPEPEPQPQTAPPDLEGLFTRGQRRVLDCAGCMLMLGEPDIVPTMANMIVCRNTTKETVIPTLHKAADAGLIAAEPSGLTLPGQRPSAEKHMLTDAGRAFVQPRVQPDCGLREAGPPIRPSWQQERAIKCATCIISQARERNALVDTPAERESEEATVPAIVECTGMNIIVAHKAIGVFVKAGYLEKTRITGAQALRRDRLSLRITELGERRLGVALNPDCPGADKQAQARLFKLSPAVWSILRCFDCVSDTISQPDGAQYELPGVTASMISSCTGLDPEYVGGTLRRFAAAHYIRRVDSSEYFGFNGHLSFYLPNPRIGNLLLAAGTTLPPGPNCYMDQLQQAPVETMRQLRLKNHWPEG